MSKDSLLRLYRYIENCTNCSLSQTRANVVVGDGAIGAKIMFIAEAPGQKEDETGLTFQGKSGDLFNKMLNAMKLTRDDVFITNVVRCRPPQNRTPAPQEISACRGYLLSQIALVNPQLIITFGATSARSMLDTQISLGRLRGQIHDWNSIPLIVTYHPSYLLRNPAAKRDVWNDLKMAMNRLDSE